jgi:thioredoxin 1
MSKVTEVNADTFQTEVLNAEIPVLVEFYGTTCPPCRAMAPVLENLAASLAGQAKIVKVNAWDEIDLAASWRVSAVPTFLAFHDGQATHPLVGSQPESRLKALLKRPN